MVELIKTDFLVIGSGIAGLSFAIQASKHGKVTIVTKKEIMESNTNLAQGGIAAVLGKNDFFKLHINDTLKNGCGLCNVEAVETLVKNGPNAINWLIQQGVEFDEYQGQLDLGMEGGHSRRRIVHKGDFTGREIEEALVSSIRRNGIDTFENCFALNLIVKGGQSYGAQILDLKNGKIITFLSKVTVLATGGIGQIYSQTTNPYIATGDGIAIAYRAGAKLEDMEFIQFHPTSLQRSGEPNFLISEAVRGESGVLRNINGEAFMEKYHESRDLAPRDVVSRAVFEELKKGKVYLDMRHEKRSFIMDRFPTIYKECLRHGIDMTKDMIPVVPAAHFLCGGIKVNLYGESNISSLFAFGECSCTGVHGANRLASNSLLESVVFSTLSINKAKSYLDRNYLTTIPKEPSIQFDGKENQRNEFKLELQNLMWDYIGIVREMSGLEHANFILQEMENEVAKIVKDMFFVSFFELQNMITVAQLVSKAASIRRESRGTHYLIEHSTQDDKNWVKHIIFQGGKIEIS